MRESLYKIWMAPRWAHFAIALILVTIVMIMRWYAQPVLGERAQFVFLTIPVAIAAFVGGLWPGLADVFGRLPQVPPLAELSERMLFAEAVDAVRCLDEGVLRSYAEANVGSVIGIGFPAWTGGVLRFVDQYPGGVAGFVARARELADTHGERFAPTESLVELARTGGTLG